jgi:hypothetical protein
MTCRSKSLFINDLYALKPETAWALVTLLPAAFRTKILSLK